ncbi:hypothetical protein ACS0TY_011063 [Phlomoides rotata]
MQNSGLNGGGGRVRAEDVISKLKDDGDFDRLRLKIIRKLKENEELRSNIISMVKQSAALNRPGAENMKPRQLSDAIHQEIGDKLMSQISDGLWNIIRSSDGMNTEIKETVESVFEKLSNPQGSDNGESSSHKDLPSLHSKLERRDATAALGNDGTQSDGELNAPPGFCMVGVQGRNKKNQMNRPKKYGDSSPFKGKGIEENKGDNLEVDLPPPGFSSVLKRKNSGDASDEDPDLPPGFS